MSTKEVIEKLIKIADNQQKIIQKLAQSAGYGPDSGVATSSADVTSAVVPYLQQAMQAAGAKAQYGVQSANLTEDGGLHVSILQPKDYDPAEYFNLKNKFKELVSGKSLASPDGRSLPVRMVNVTGLSG